MYTEHFNFSAQPFQLTPDHRFLFESGEHSRAIAHLKYGLQQSEGFIVVTGEVGAGKTTIIGHLRECLDRHKYVSTTVVSTNLNSTEILRMISAGLGLSPGGTDKASILLEIEAFLHECARRNKRCLIFVDEGQNLSMEALEELRMLSNIHVSGIAPVQLFLLGQPQFRSILAKPDLRQLRQRVIASYHLGPLNREDTRSYILHRLNLVGWNDRPSFTDAAFDAIYAHTEGVPRRINTLCSRILLYCYLENTDHIDLAVVENVAQDLEQEFAQVLEEPAAPQLTDQAAPTIEQAAPAKSTASSSALPQPTSQNQVQRALADIDLGSLEGRRNGANGGRSQRWQDIINLIEATPAELFTQGTNGGTAPNGGQESWNKSAGASTGGSGADTQTIKKLLLLVLEEYLNDHAETRQG